MEKRLTDRRVFVHATLTMRLFDLFVSDLVCSWLLKSDAFNQHVEQDTKKSQANKIKK